MKKAILIFLCFGVLTSSLSQEDNSMAKKYFDDSQFAQAAVLYEKLLKISPRRTDYLEALVSCYQQLEQFDEAEKALLKRINKKNAFPTLYIELGQNHILKGEEEEAQNYFKESLGYLEENPSYAYALGSRFQKYGLLDWAIKTYQIGLKLKPDLNFGFQLARVYGEKGNIEQMFRAYLELLATGKSSKSNVLRNLEDFIKEEETHENNQLLKRILLENAQSQPDVVWNEMLSWLFVKQGQLNSAFTQERAIFKREGGISYSRMMNLGYYAKGTGDHLVAQKAFAFVKQKSKRPETIVEASLQLLELQIEEAGSKDLEKIATEFNELTDQFGDSESGTQLKIQHAFFLCFKQNKAEEAIALLENTLEQTYGDFSIAQLKMALGDVLVYDEQFNKALILYTQVQRSLKNDVMAQQARFKVAKASFYKGDFDWALTQLKVLRGSTSQLTANDAMQLSLLISDNIQEDSTQTALKKYAHADLLSLQNRKEQAEMALKDILENHKGESIEDEALLKYGKMMVSKGAFNDAEMSFRKIIEFFSSDILVDQAHFELGELYEKNLKDLEKAKYHYEQIIFNHQDSYLFPIARERFRVLRGDEVN